VRAERWSATQDCATRREPHKTSYRYFIAAGCGAAGLDQRLNLAINAGLADPRLKARLDEIGLFDERDLATISRRSNMQMMSGRRLPKASTAPRVGESRGRSLPHHQPNNHPGEHSHNHIAGEYKR
jgi:hypothetical protein